MTTLPEREVVAPEGEPAVEIPWRRLDHRMLVVGPLSNVIPLLPFLIILLITGSGDVGRLWGAAAAAVLVVVLGAVRWATTRYRITDERVELRTGLLNRQRRSVPRDRIRTVDTTAKLLHRIFGLSVVRVSAAAGAALEAKSGLSLDAVSKPEAERLRLELLGRGPVTPSTAAPAQAVEELARLRWSWIRFAPLTLSSLAAVAAVIGTVVNLLDDVGVSPDEAFDEVAGVVMADAVAVAVLVLAVAVVAAMGLYAERWYGYRLTREPDGTLRVRRGLLTRRSVSVSGDRLRGAEVSEPLLLRAGRGGQARVISTGLAGRGEGAALGPPMPVAEGHRLAAAVLRAEPGKVTRAPLRRHPRAALVRRLTRWVLGATATVAVLWLLDAWVFGTGWLGPVALATLLPAGALIGLDAYRNLGHALVGAHLVTRRGSLHRRTVALQTHGVIGWTFRQTVFQRRAGLATLRAVTAAGDGSYVVADVAASDAVALADAVVPGLLTPLRP